jgi:DNA-binding MarR family transcriptional regulator
MSKEYQALAEFRYQIRRFIRFSEQAAREGGLEPQQHQLLLAVKGLPDDSTCTITELADRLQIQHHSTVELVDRLEERGLVTRKRGMEDRRQVVVQLTAKGERLLRDLSLHHRDELRSQAPLLVNTLKKLITALKGGARSRAASATGAARKRSRVAKAHA